MERTFDAVAPIYEKLRPGYCPQLYQMIFDYSGVDAASNVMEIGIGGGQAAPPFLQTGCRLTAVELGENFSQLCKEKFRAYPKFQMITGRFEDADLEEGAYDLIYAASAFHWIPEEVGYSKVFSLLRPGGSFARFANHPFRGKGNPALCEEMDRIYERYYYRYYQKPPKKPVEYTEEEAKRRAAIAERYGFRDIRHALFHRTRVLSAAEYRMLLGTYSDHIAIEEKIREEFFASVEKAVERRGGAIAIDDVMDLQLARKP